VKAAKRNTEPHSKTSLRLRRRSIPTIVPFRMEEKAARKAGAMDSRAISG